MLVRVNLDLPQFGGRMKQIADQNSDSRRLPKNFPALQERMETVKRSGYEKKQVAYRSPLEKMVDSDKDTDTFFLL
jgi:cell fate (sporulation/competence/biofilm development) regulator YlbF (YheA/YmcA/DUF963 family)